MTNRTQILRSVNIKVMPSENVADKGRRSSGNVSKRITNSSSSCWDENVYSPYDDPDSEFFIEPASSSDEDISSQQRPIACPNRRRNPRTKKAGALKRKRPSNYPRLTIVRMNTCSEAKTDAVAPATTDSEQPRELCAAKRTRTVLTPRSLDAADSYDEIERELQRQSPTKLECNLNISGEFDWGAETTAAASQLSSQTIEVPTQSTPDDDLLHNSMMSTEQLSVKKTRAKRFRKGGFVEKLQQAIQVSKLNQSFLDCDKKFGLVHSQRLTVRRLEVCCGVQMAEVDVAGSDDTVNIVIGAKLEPHVHVGTQLEAYFQTDFPDYTIRRGQRDEPCYVKPHRLILAKDV